jgi:hypothetical protein
MTTPTLSIGARDLYSLLGAVVPFAGKDRYGLPLLAAVRVEARGDHLLAMATDRYRIGVKRHTGSGEWSPDFAATIPLGTIRTLQQMFKPMRGMDVDLTLTPNEDGSRVAVEAVGALSDLLSALVEFSLVSGEYPKFASVILEGFEREPEGSVFAVAPRLLADFGKLASPGLLIKSSGPNKPIIFSDREGFIGALMPKRLPGDEVAAGIPDVDGWRALLAPTAKKAPAKRKGAAA